MRLISENIISKAETKSFLKLQTNCYVCGRVIKNGGVYVGKGLYRHTECEPGSYRWLKSHVGKKSDIRDYFLKEGQDISLS